MKRQVNAIVVGLGFHGRDTVKLLEERNVNIVAGIDPASAGEDLGILCEVSSLVGSKVLGSFVEASINLEQIDVAIITAKVDIPELTRMSLELLSQEINVLTINEDAFDLETFFPQEFQLIDQSAKSHGVSFVATGGGDALWSGLIIHMSSQLRQLKGIHLFTYIGIDGYPQEFLTECGVGNTHAQFTETSALAAEVPSPFGGVLPSIARKLGLTIVDERREFRVYVEEEPHFSQTFQRIIPAGEPLGRYDTVIARTAEDIDLTAELLTSGVNGRDELIATFDGVPQTSMSYRLEPQHLSTDAATISRVVDVIKAKPGVISTSELPTPFYRRELFIETDTKKLIG